MEKNKLIKDMDVRNVEQIFSRPEAPMEIPEYQRTYAWNTDEINDFIGDLKRLQISRNQNSAKTHFMGGIVAYEEEKPGSIPKRIHYIVDGQQRLITFQLLFSVIRKHYERLHESFSRAQNDEYAQRASNKIKEVNGFFIVQVTDRLGDQHNVDTLKPSPMDREIYRKILKQEDDRSDEATESHKRLRKARNKIDRELVTLCKNESGSNEEYFEKLGVLLECIKTDCQVIYIVCPNLNDAYELFQVLNDRGKSLTDGDLLRAHTFKLVGEANGLASDTEELRLYWDEILSDSDANVKQFLEQYFRIVTSGNPQKRQLYRQYQEEIFGDSVKGTSKEETIQMVKSKVKDMRDWYRIFTELREGNWPYEKDHAAIEEYDKYRLKLLIKVLDLKNLSILMAAARRQDQPSFRNVVFIVEKFFFRYLTICSGSADVVGKTFGDYAHKISNQQFTMQEFQKTLSGLIASDASDDVFKTQLRLSLVFKEGKTKQIIRYFLVYLEHHRKLFQLGLLTAERKLEKTPLHIVERSSSIEHVYPQNPITRIAGIEDHQSRGNLTNCLGNLTFLSRDDNTTLGNKDYASKKKLLLESNVWLNKHLAQTYQDWSELSIIDRENWLLDKAVEVFKL